MRAPWRRSIASLDTKALGDLGERAAARWLRRNRYRVLLRNETCAVGEADLIALGPDKRTVVFVEVKTRRASAVEGERRPEANITERKRAKLLHVARTISRDRGWLGRPLRIDVIAVELSDRAAPRVRHYENAITG
ncbi:MAG: YraN family protein [Planctomycetota bacterium]